MHIKRINTVIEWLGKLPTPALSAIALLLVILVGLLDMLTGYEWYVSVFYLFPILMLAWFWGGFQLP